MNDLLGEPELLLSPDQLEAALRRIGAERYHNLHPFHKLLHGGKLNKGQVQAWALNRYYYQCSIPRKDCAIMSNMQDRAMRREWRQRYFDHDGLGEDEDGIERWLNLTDALGLDREYVVSTAGILPATRLAVNAYVHFARDKPILESIASSLTELFAAKIHGKHTHRNVITRGHAQPEEEQQRQGKIRQRCGCHAELWHQQKCRDAARGERQQDTDHPRGRIPAEFVKHKSPGQNRDETAEGKCGCHHWRLGNR